MCIILLACWTFPPTKYVASWNNSKSRWHLLHFCNAVLHVPHFEPGNLCLIPVYSEYRWRVNYESVMRPFHVVGWAKKHCPYYIVQIHPLMQPAVVCLISTF